MFTKIGLNDWTHAMGAFKKHGFSFSHKASGHIWRIKNTGAAPVSIQIHEGNKKEVLENRANLAKII